MKSPTQPGSKQPGPKQADKSAKGETSAQEHASNIDSTFSYDPAAHSLTTHSFSGPDFHSLGHEDSRSLTPQMVKFVHEETVVRSEYSVTFVQGHSGDVQSSDPSPAPSDIKAPATDRQQTQYQAQPAEGCATQAQSALNQLAALGFKINFAKDSYTVTHSGQAPSGNPACAPTVSITASFTKAEQKKAESERHAAIAAGILKNVDHKSHQNPLDNPAIKKLLAKASIRSVELSDIAELSSTTPLVIKAPKIAITRCAIKETALELCCAEYSLKQMTLSKCDIKFSPILKRGKPVEIRGEISACSFGADSLMLGDLGVATVDSKTKMNCSAPTADFRAVVWSDLERTSNLTDQQYNQQLEAFKTRNVGFVFARDKSSASLRSISVELPLEEFSSNQVKTLCDSALDNLTRPSRELIRKEFSPAAAPAEHAADRTSTANSAGGNPADGADPTAQPVKNEAPASANRDQAAPTQTQPAGTQAWLKSIIGFLKIPDFFTRHKHWFAMTALAAVAAVGALFGRNSSTANDDESNDKQALVDQPERTKSNDTPDETQAQAAPDPTSQNTTAESPTAQATSQTANIPTAADNAARTPGSPDAQTPNAQTQAVNEQVVIEQTAQGFPPAGLQSVQEIIVLPAPANNQAPATNHAPAPTEPQNPPASLTELSAPRNGEPLKQVELSEEMRRALLGGSSGAQSNDARSNNAANGVKRSTGSQQPVSEEFKRAVTPPRNN